MKTRKIYIKETTITVFTQKEEDYISLTDIARYKDFERSDYILQNWMRNRGTLEFLGLWEKINNFKFNSIEFDGIKAQAGRRRYMIHYTIDRVDPQYLEVFARAC